MSGGMLDDVQPDLRVHRQRHGNGEDAARRQPRLLQDPPWWSPLPMKRSSGEKAHVASNSRSQIDGSESCSDGRRFASAVRSSRSSSRMRISTRVPPQDSISLGSLTRLIMRYSLNLLI